MKCVNCGKPKNKHTMEITRKNRKDIEVLYCYPVEEFKDGKIDWNTFLKKKWKELKKEKEVEDEDAR